MRYFDIHTHFAPSLADVTAIRTVIAGRETPPVTGVFSIGVHPWYPCEIDQVAQYGSDPRCVAIGECGLDSSAQTPMKDQERLFREQIELSEALEKPLIVHCVRMYEQVLRLRQMRAPRQRWVIHGFRKGPQLARQLLDCGFDLSFGAALLHAGSALQESLQLVPIDRFFLETDDQSETEIAAVYNTAARIRGTKLSTLADAIECNAAEVFRVH